MTSTCNVCNGVVVHVQASWRSSTGKTAPLTGVLTLDADDHARGPAAVVIHDRADGYVVVRASVAADSEQRWRFHVCTAEPAPIVPGRLPPRPPEARDITAPLHTD